MKWSSILKLDCSNVIYGSNICQFLSAVVQPISYPCEGSTCLMTGECLSCEVTDGSIELLDKNLQIDTKGSTKPSPADR